MHRPTSLVVIATLWVVLGVGWVLSGLMTVVSCLTLPAQLAAAGGPSTLPDQAQGIVDFVVVAGLAQMGAGVAGVMCASGLLRLRAWGRRGLEALTVLFMVVVAGFSAWGLFTSMSSYDPVALIAPLLVGTLFLVPLWIVRKHLRGRAIHEAILVAEQQLA
jgi:hypothetical protein